MKMYGSIVDSGAAGSSSGGVTYTDRFSIATKDRAQGGRGTRPAFILALVGSLALVGTAMIAIGSRLLPDTSAVKGAVDPESNASLQAARRSSSFVEDRPVVGRAFPIASDQDQHQQQEGQEKRQQQGDVSPPLSFTALNFYHVRDGKPAQDYPWLKDVKLIEPHRETTLDVETPRDGFEYRWKVLLGAPVSITDSAPASSFEEEGVTEEVVATASGAEAVVVFTHLGENSVSLEEVNSDTGVVTRRLQEKVMVKYVRREIRTLTDDEREELFDAMFALWEVRVDGGNGKELYGEDYADIYAINRLHYKAASQSSCDHFHDGLGFLTSHSMISNTFEFSLQKVNPKLTLPYWDFTIESTDVGGLEGTVDDGGPLTRSPLFRPDWFGTFDPEDNMVKDGRWAFTEIPRVFENNPGLIDTDVYGKLRAPWNVNDRQYLTRGMGELCGADMEKAFPWPTCTSHYDLATGYSDFYSWVWQSLYDPHGPVHIWVGGVLDCEETYERIEGLVGKIAASQLAEQSFIHRKNLYRDGIFKCDGRADVAQSSEEVMLSRCGCLGYNLTEGNDYERIYHTMSVIDDVIGDYDADTKRQVVEAICTTTLVDGDHLQASSSLDPSFWSTHPTMERLWMYVVLTGQITDWSWPDADVTYTTPDGTVVTESLSEYEESCFGHHGSDVFPFGLLDTDTDGFEIKTGISFNSATGNELTNREALQAFDPRINALPYVYDTFNWEHCAADGYDFGDAWQSSTKKSKSTSARPAFEDGVPRAPMYSSTLKLMAEGKAKRREQRV
ncbi:TYRosinase family member (tyr-4) [Ectocarpus siliculosus]|uniref:TYRosinase family member (Tyr-4) n=1 Tax=Ectocarpus siliculosus TaxID=2880 RepID=D8LC42_ECTSI|nr:TYRosinase family member (tyr-4) [Ectocarpus siliculosus]|eukprot:CBN79225.1 TYRosinase family member (tyr-4) [Ectocarpus siliculosus]